MRRELLLNIVKEALRERGYHDVEPQPDSGGIWRHPDGATDYLLPTIIDCFEREAQ